MTTTERPEIGASAEANDIRTNYLEAGKGDETVLLIHGSGPGVTSYANWRVVVPSLAEDFHVVAPDMVGFGYSDRPEGVTYGLQTWADQTVGLMDTLGIEKAHLVGNSFGGAIALRIATQHPQRVGKLVLMGSMGVPFEITEGLDRVWGYEPSFENMRKVLDVFAYSRDIAGARQSRADAAGCAAPAICAERHRRSARSRACATASRRGGRDLRSPVFSQRLHANRRLRRFRTDGVE